MWGGGGYDRVRGVGKGVRRSDSFVDDWVGERANFFDIYADGIARLKPDRRRASKADAVRCAGENDGAGQKGFAGTEKFNDGGHVEDHIIGVPVLHGFTVEQSADSEGVGVGDYVAGDEDGAERAKRIEAFALAPLAATAVALPVAGGDVVCAGIAENVVEGIGAGDVFTALANDDGEFAFVVDLRARKFDRELDRVAGVLNSGGILDEQHGVFRERAVALGCVLFVVEADAGKIGGNDWGEEFTGHDDTIGDTEIAEDIADNFTSRTVGLQCGVSGASRGEVADDFHRP